MVVDTLSFANDPNIGLYGFATDEYCLVGEATEKERKKLKHLSVKIIENKISGTDLAGIFCSGNSNGIIVPGIIQKRELDGLLEKANVLVLEGMNTALGNLILANDKGCLISEKLKKSIGDIEDFLKVPVKVGFVSEIDLVGAYAIATNKGCLTSRSIASEEKGFLEEALGVGSGPATVNFGSTFVKSGVIANTHSVFAGNKTSGPELERITSALGFI